MAASMGIQATAPSYLRIVDSSIVASSKRKGVVISKSDSNVADIVRLRRNVIVQSPVITECGGRGSLQCVNSKVGFGVHRALGTGWTEEQSAIGSDPRANGGRVRAAAVAPQADFEARPEPKVTFVPLALIGSEVEFDRVLSEAQDRNEPIIIDWMASWCRKCLYLKPKLEKLAAAFHPSIRFYYVDVNSVPQAMVKRANVTQMPTIQLWRNGTQEGQVIGGHEANTVLELVKDMIAKSAPMI